MKTSDIVLKFTSGVGKTTFITITDFVKSHPDSFDGELSDEVYRWEDGPRGWAYYPIVKH